MRWDDFSATMASGPRVGQKVLQQVNTRIVQQGVKFLQARADDGTCAPGRASLITGNYSNNHGIGPGNTNDDYYYFYRLGKKAAAYGTGTAAKVSRWIGPWEFDRAIQAGLAEVPVIPADQGVVGGTQFVSGYGTASRVNPLLRGDSTTPDDLQAFTGSIGNWLGRNNRVRCGLVGKYQNGYADVPPTNSSLYLTPQEQYLFVPPGWAYWAALSGDAGAPYNGGAADHWHVKATLYNEPTNPGVANPGQGNGAVGTTIAYQYDLPISTITWTSGTVTVTVDGAGKPHRLAIGDEVSIEGVTPAAYNTATGTAGFIVTGVPSAYSFTYALAASSLSAGSGATMRAFARTQYGDYMWGTRGVEFVNSCQDNEPWFLYLNYGNPHQGVGTLAGGSAENDAYEIERRYLNTVNPNDFSMWGGVAGAISPAHIVGSATSANKTQWIQRQEGMASTDDAIGMVLDACDARGWTDVTIILTSDNGHQDGEQELGEGAQVWGTLGTAKGYIYDGSVRIPFVVKTSDWTPNTTNNLLISQADVPLTLLDWFGFSNHHAHTKRDGCSIVRLVTPTGQIATGASYANRAIPIQRGSYRNIKYEGLVDRTLKKIVRPWGATPVIMWEVANDLDYEMTDISSANSTNVAKTTEMVARLNLLRDVRWNGTTNTSRTS